VTSTQVESMVEARAPVRPDASLLIEVEAKAPVRVSRCYQCRKCTLGCPLSAAMDLLPNQVVRMVQLGMRDEVLRSKTLWICASCHTCTTRCPNGIDIAQLMDALRQIGKTAAVAPADPRARVFHEQFLRSVERHGRVFELGMTGRFKLKVGDLWSDKLLGWWMLRRRKLRLWPSRIKDRKQVRAFFRAAEKG
jgi:heterodisulfide reductase subunit C